VYGVTNRFREAESTMKRSIDILLDLLRKHDYLHPSLKEFTFSYAGMLQKLEWSNDQIINYLRKIAPELYQ
jgi:hypothetical protein